MDEPVWEISRALAALQGPAGYTLRWNTLPLAERFDQFETGASGLLVGPGQVWRGDDLVSNLCAVGTRRLVETDGNGWPFRAARFTVRLESILAFLSGGLDERRISRLTRALMNIQWESSDHPISQTRILEPAYGLCRTSWAERTPGPDNAADGHVFRLLTRGRGTEALRAALRRLTAWGVRSRVDASRHALALGAPDAKRIAASLLIPISHRDLTSVARSLRRHNEANAVA